MPVPRGSKAKHGSRTRYMYGCRCEACREAQRRYKADRKASMVPVGRRKAHDDVVDTLLEVLRG